MSGVAAKGIMWKAQVTAWELKSDGSHKANVGTATTNDKGLYSISLDSSYGGGPIEVDMTTTSNTLMKCDAPAGKFCGAFSTGDTHDTNSNGSIDRGEWYHPSNTVTLQAAVPGSNTKDSTLDVSVTPFTTMAAKRAAAMGGLTKDNIDKANTAVSRLLDPNVAAGIDVLKTKPVDVTDTTSVSTASPAAKLYAAYSASVMNRIAQTSTTSGTTVDVQQAVDDLANTFSSTGSMSTTDLKTIVDDTNTQLTDSGVTGDTTVSTAVDDVNTEINDAESSGGTTVTPSTTTSTATTDLATVKNFVNDVTTWGNVVHNDLQAPASAFSQQVDMARQAATMVSPDMAQSFAAAADMASRYYQGGSADMSTYVSVEGGLILSASGTMSKNANGDVVITGATITANTPNGYSSTNPLQQTVNMTVHFPSMATASSFTANVVSATVENMAAKLSFSNLSLGVTYASAVDPNSTAAQSPQYVTLSGGMALAQKMDVYGNTATDPVSFTGTVDTKLVPATVPNGSGSPLLVPANLSLDGKFADTTGNSVQASLAASIDNAGSFTPVGYAHPLGYQTTVAQWSTQDGSTPFGPGNPMTFSSPMMPNTKVVLSESSSSGPVTVTQYYPYGNYSTTAATLQGFVAGWGTDYSTNTLTSSWTQVFRNNFYPYVSNDGWYMTDSCIDNATQSAVTDPTTTVSGSCSGHLAAHDGSYQIEDANNWLQASNITLQFGLQLSNLPKATATVSANRTGFSTGAAKVTIAYGARSITVNAPDTATTSTPTITVTGSDGVTISMPTVKNSTGGYDFDPSGGSVMYNGKKFASVVPNNNLLEVDYNDGTFVTLQ